MHRIWHLIPENGGAGGVESAAHCMNDASHEEIQFSVEFMYGPPPQKRYVTPLQLVIDVPRSALKICRSGVDVLIVSLWKAYIVGIIAKIARPQIKLVVLLHNAEDAHFLDRIFTRWAVRMADAVWVDCEATAQWRLPAPLASYRVISFVARNFDAPPSRRAEPSFIFWGRLCDQKGLDRALRIFAKIRERKPSATFQLIGPEAGASRSLHGLCKSLGVNEAAFFTGLASHEEIAAFAQKASFYLQTSVYEGIAMSVIEAMQLGLVPVVTPAGEIGGYCRDGYNSILIRSDEQAVDDVLRLLDSNALYQSASANAIAAWRGATLYRESMLNACEELIKARRMSFTSRSYDDFG